MHVNDVVVPILTGLMVAIVLEEMTFTAWFVAYGQLQELFTPRVPIIYIRFPSLRTFVYDRLLTRPPQPGVARTALVAKGRRHQEWHKRGVRYGFLLVFALVILSICFTIASSPTKPTSPGGALK